MHAASANKRQQALLCHADVVCLFMWQLVTEGRAGDLQVTRSYSFSSILPARLLAVLYSTSNMYMKSCMSCHVNSLGP